MTPEGSLGVVHRSHRPAPRPVEWIQLSRELLPGWQYGAETQWLTSDEYTTEQAALKCFDLVARSLDSAGRGGPLGDPLSGTQPAVRRRGPPSPPTMCCTLRDLHLLRSGEREHAAHAEPGGVPIGPRQADQRGRFEAERVRPHRRLSLSVGFVYARTAPAKQRQLFARGSYLPGSSKRAWNRSSIRVRQDSAEGEPAPGPTAAGCWPLAAR